jgi:hypothetical protein
MYSWILWPWRWKRYVPPKTLLTFTEGSWKNEPLKD